MQWHPFVVVPQQARKPVVCRHDRQEHTHVSMLTQTHTCSSTCACTSTETNVLPHPAQAWKPRPFFSHQSLLVPVLACLSPQGGCGALGRQHATLPIAPQSIPVLAPSVSFGYSLFSDSILVPGEDLNAWNLLTPDLGRVSMPHWSSRLQRVLRTKLLGGNSPGKRKELQTLITQLSHNCAFHSCTLCHTPDSASSWKVVYVMTTLSSNSLLLFYPPFG